MSGRRVSVIVASLICIGVLTAVLWGRARRPQLRNVIVISIDTLRADHLSYAGYEKPTSPAIDMLAVESLDFRQAFSQAPETLPSHASMLTSLYPSVHKAHVDTGSPLADDYSTLAEFFRDAGYRTGAFVGGAQMSPLWKLDHGFEVYDASRVYENEDIVPDDIDKIVDKAMRWIGQHRHEPFFCFVHTYCVREPWTPPAGYDRMFDEGYEGPLPFYTGLGDWWELKKTSVSPDDPDVRHIVSLYDGEVRYMDDQVGRLLGGLKALGLDDQTVIAFTSDHGEEFAEHGVVGRHGHTLADELLHVPLLIRVPGLQARIIKRQVRLIDLAPTLLALMGIDRGDVAMQGVNLLAEEGADETELAVFSEMNTPTGALTSLRVSGRKILSAPDGRIKVYDLEEDPGETQDRFDWNLDDHQQLVKKIQGMMSENRERALQQTPKVELDPQTEAQLRSLGYIR